MLDSLHIKNFRCFEDLTIPSLGRVNLIVGKNNSGKSTLLEAISIYAQDGTPEAIKNLLNNRHDFFNNTIQYDETKNSFSIKTKSVELCIEQEFDVYKGGWFYRPCMPSHRDYYGQDTIPFAMVNSQVAKENDLALQWDSAYLDSEEHIAREMLTIFNADITNVIFVQSPEKKEERVAILKIKGKAKAVPLKAMGEGVSRILQIFLNALKAKNGLLLIDEFENGLHYSIQEEVWEKLFKLAKELDIQVFATTHSEDTVKAFSKVALQSEDENAARIISLGRSVGKSEYGKIFATVFDRDGLELISETEIEVR